MVVLDIQKNKVEIVKVVQIFNTINVGAVCSFDLPEEARLNGKYVPQKIAEFAKSCLVRIKLDKEKIILLLPDRLIISREFTHNKNSRENLSALSILEAEAILHKPTLEYVITTYEYGKRLTIDGVYKSGLYVVKKNDLNEFIEAFSDYKLKLVKVLPPIYAYSLMMLRILKQEQNKNFFDDVVVGIDLGTSRSLVSVVCQNTVLYERGMGSVFDDVIAYISSHLNVDTDTAYEFFFENGISPNSDGYINNTRFFEEVKNLFTSSVQEIFRSIRLILSTERLELGKIFLSGTTTTIPGLDDFISSLGSAESFFVKDLLNNNIIKYNPTIIDINKYINLLGAVYITKKALTDFLSVKEKRKIRTVNKKTIITVAILSILVMAIQPIYYLVLVQRQTNDKATIQKYASIYNMLNVINTSQIKRSAQTKDIQKLFLKKTSSYKVIEKLFEGLGLKNNIVNLNFIENSKNIDITFRVNDFNTYVQIRNAFDKSPNFKINIPFNAKLQQNGSYIIKGEIAVLERAYE